MRALPAGYTDVGVIPRREQDCPASEYVSMYMDDEDDGNSSWMNGWTGAFSERVIGHVNGTTLGFCRVSGNLFHSLNPGSAPQSDWYRYTYAVLKLGVMCPNGSFEYTVHIDNEDDNNQNSSTGSISPNVSNTNTDLRFCVFMPTGTSADMSAFPAGAFTYGVLAGKHPAPGGTYVRYWKETGVVYTDDEDSGNNNSDHTGSMSATNVTAARTTLEFNGGENTIFYLARVSDRLGLCGSGVTTYSGAQAATTYDGANCLFRAVPGGWSPFIWNNSYYVHPQSGNQCPSGSVFDTQHCYFGSAPSNRTAFMWGGNFY